jgi:peptide/nickel transport system ATP-binding protein
MTPVLDVSHLCVDFRSRSRRGEKLAAVSDVSFSLDHGETLALVGESGSGKTTIARAILGLVRPTSGAIALEGRDITDLRGRRRRALARDLQVVFQDPYSSLNPYRNVGSTLVEPLRVQKVLSRKEIDAAIESLLSRVKLPPDSGTRFPSHFSGGQRQRIAIARALSVGPKLVVCDEPTSALDVSTQARVLGLFRELQQQSQLSYLFITHDLAVVRHFADRVLVLHHGRIVETGSAEQICEHPVHPYTQALVSAVPVPDPVVQRRRRLARTRSTQPAAELPERIGPASTPDPAQDEPVVESNPA